MCRLCNVINASLVNNLSGKIESEKSQTLEPNKDLSLTEHESEPEYFESLITNPDPSQISHSQQAPNQLSFEPRTKQVTQDNTGTAGLDTTITMNSEYNLSGLVANIETPDTLIAHKANSTAMSTTDSLLLQTKMLTLANQGSLINQPVTQQTTKDLPSTIQHQEEAVKLETQLASHLHHSTIDQNLTSLHGQTVSLERGESKVQGFNNQPIVDLNVQPLHNHVSIHSNFTTTFEQETSRTRISFTELNKLFNNEKTSLTEMRTSFSVYQPVTTFKSESTAILTNNSNKPLQNSFMPFTTSQTSVKTEQIITKINSEVVPSTTLKNSAPTMLSSAQDFVLFDDSKTEFAAISRFTSFSATEQPFVANWQSQSIITESKDASIMQITDPANDKIKITYGNSNNTILSTGRFEQQKEIQLKQIASNINYSEVKIKDSKLGDIHFSVSGKQKEHLGVFVTQSQTQNIIQTHFQDIQQELAKEGVTDFEMFSSKEDQEQQKREYLAQQSKSFAQIQDDLEASDLPVIQANLISHYSPSSINITA